MYPLVMICEWLAHNRIHRSAEARNKNAKKYRLNLTRKISRLAANTHLINRLLLSSEPLITAQRKLPCKKLIYQNQSLIYLNSWQTLYFLFVLIYYYSLFLLQHNMIIYIFNLARTPEIGQGLGRILSCGARKQEQT